MKTIAIGIALLAPALAEASTPWSASARDYGESASDFVLREVERRPQSSVLQLDAKKMGSSVGASLIISCMVMRLAEERGKYRYLVKIDQRATNPAQMLVAFAHRPGEKPKSLDAELPDSAREIDLQEFGPDFNKACRKPR